MFLTTVTSRRGHNIITGPHKTRLDDKGRPLWYSKWVDLADHSAVNIAIQELSKDCSGIYYGLGAFAKDAEGKLRRAQVQCEYLRSFWLDIDAGQEKFARTPQAVYPTQQDALSALQEFIGRTGLVAPTYTVSSGEGLHVYWTFPDDIPIAVWKPIAERLKHVTRAFGLKADPSRTADAASVLRPVGTFHHSGKPVEVLETTYVYDLDTFAQQLESISPDFVPNQQHTSSAALSFLGPTPNYISGYESSMDAQVVNDKSAEYLLTTRRGKGLGGCQAMDHIYLNQATAPYPEWAAALSVVKFCKDGEQWAINLSEGHPGFSKQSTLVELDKWESPRTCEWFQSNTNYCTGCQFRPNIRSPISLAIVPDAAPPPPEGLPYDTSGFVTGEAAVAVSITDSVERTVPTLTADGSTVLKTEMVQRVVQLPQLFFPYSFSESGGLQMRLEGEDITFYQYAFYLVDRIGVGDSNESRFWFRLHTPFDGVKDFELSSDEVVADNQTLRQALSRNNIWLDSAKDYTLMSLYIRRSLQNRQRSAAQLKAPRQMGWDGDNFVHGRLAFSATGPFPSPIYDSNIARSFDKATAPTKDPFSPEALDEWNDVLRQMYDYEDGLMYQMVIAMALGAPIRSKFGADVERGGIFNLYSEGSGVGKSTAAYTALRIFGDPRAYTVNGAQGATTNAFFTKMAYVNSTPMLFDEIGGLSYEQMMAFIHDSTRGSERMRMQASTNDLRDASEGWHSYTISTSNRSIWDAIAGERVESEAYLMRVCEVIAKPVEAIAKNPERAAALQVRLEKLHGIVAPRLLDYIVRHMAEVEVMWNNARNQITTVCGLTAKMRYWANMGAAAVVGAQLGEMLGLLPFNAQKVYEETVRMINAQKARAKTKETTGTNLLSEFLAINVSSILVVHNENATLQAPPRGILARIDVWTNKLILPGMALSEYCRSRGTNLERMEQVIMEYGGVRTQYPIMKNTSAQAAALATPSWEVDLNNIPDLTLQKVVNEEPTE